MGWEVTKIEISNCKLLDKGSQRMSCQVQFGPVTIYGWKVVVPSGKEPFSAPPQIPVKPPDGGETKWYPMLKVEGELRKQIDEAVLAKWREMSAEPHDDHLPF